MAKKYQITVRGLDAATKQRLLKQAAKQGVSLNQLAVSVLSGSVGSVNQAKNDLSRYTGRFEFDKNFSSVAEAQRQIDAELWR